jgi:hypothetical protein
MPADPKKPMAPAMLTLIQCLARRAAQDYLAEQTAPQRDSSPSRTKRVPLPDLNKAA